ITDAEEHVRQKLRAQPVTSCLPYTTLFRSLPAAGAAHSGGSRRPRCPSTGTGRRPADRRSVEGTSGRPGRGRLPRPTRLRWARRSEEHTSELQSRSELVCRLLLEKENRLWY